MITVAAIMFGGILTGYLLRNQKKLIVLNGSLTMWVIYMLLFFLGLSIGSNKSIINHLHTLGFTALVITLAAVAGSLLVSWALWYFVFKSGRIKQ
jgi:uncharacterized membrane protein YbjE (DUF340 family)